MMGYLYRKSYTTAQFFQVEPRRLLKIFLWVFGIAIVSTYAFSWLTVHALHDTTIPDDSSMKFKDSKSIMEFLLNFFFFALIVLANLYSQALKKIAWIPYLLALGFYAMFIIKDAYYISPYFDSWQQALKLLKEDLNDDFHSEAWIKNLLGLVVTAFNAFMIWWGLRK
jgi:anaerobic C4-dicarboxylate transporter